MYMALGGELQSHNADDATPLFVGGAYLSILSSYLSICLSIFSTFQ